MKKICFITTVSGTLISFVVSTAQYLHEHGDYDITFICNPDEAFAATLPSYIHYIPVPMRRGISLGGFSAIRAFKKIFREHRFDIVQYATPNAALYASIAARSVGVPVRLYTQWGIRYVGFDGLMRRVFKMLEKKVCRNSTAIRAVSPQNKAFSVAEGLYPAEKALVLGRGGTIGVDLDAYPVAQKAAMCADTRAQYGVQTDFVFGFAGRLSRDKGGRELLTAFRALCEIRSDISLMIVGANETGDGQDPLMEWAKGSDRVIFTGRIHPAAMPRHYAAMDVLVHPTYREGFGMVIQEAGAMGVPVITTRIPGASEVLEEGVSCLLCEPRDAADLQRAMEQLCDHPRADAMGVAARAFVETHYERAAMLERQLRDYESIGAHDHA